MSSYNKVVLMGNLTRDPELQYAASGTAVCRFGIATNRQWTDKKTQEKKEEVCFVDCTAFGRTGEIVSEYLKKGSPAHIDGRLSFYQWETDDGQKRSKLSVTVESLQLLPRNNGGSGSRETGTSQQREIAPTGEMAQEQVDAVDIENGGVPF